MPVGGSSVAGLWGYIAGFQELLEQGLAEDFDDIVVAVGSGGTACGHVEVLSCTPVYLEKKTKGGEIKTCSTVNQGVWLLMCACAIVCSANIDNY